MKDHFWLCRDKDGNLKLFETIPRRFSNSKWNNIKKDWHIIPKELAPQITWEGGAIQIDCNFKYTGLTISKEKHNAIG
jgi:hypothetical protein